MQLTIHALPSGEPDAASGVARRVVADAPGSYPCRRCLRDAEAGEELLLLPYDPFPVRSPYAGEGPVFVHAAGCPPFEDEGLVPPLVERRSSMSVRAYDAAGLLVDADVVIGRDVGERAAAMLGAGADFVHVHNARQGCFMCTVRAHRAGVAFASAG